MTDYLNIKICKPTGEVLYSGIVNSEAVIFGPRTAEITLPLVDFADRLEEAVKPKEAV